MDGYNYKALKNLNFNIKNNTDLNKTGSSIKKSKKGFLRNNTDEHQDLLDFCLKLSIINCKQWFLSYFKKEIVIQMFYFVSVKT